MNESNHYKDRIYYQGREGGKKRGKNHTTTAGKRILDNRERKNIFTVFVQNRK